MRKYLFILAVVASPSCGGARETTYESQRSAEKELWLTIDALPPEGSPVLATKPASVLPTEGFPTPAPAAEPTPPPYVPPMPAESSTPASPGPSEPPPVVVSPSPAPAPQPSTDDNAAACAALHGVAKSRILVVGNQTVLNVTTNSIAAIKLAGNKPQLALHLTGAEGAKLAGLCLFVTGNQGVAKITSDIAIGRFDYVGRGNQSSTSVVFAAGAGLDTLSADLAGNQASLSLSGDGHFPCVGAELHGHGAKFNCH